MCKGFKVEMKPAAEMQNLILPSATCSWVNMFLCLPCNNIVINQSDLKSKFIIFVKV